MITICALFSSAQNAESAIQELKRAGIGEEDVTVMFEGNVASELLDRERFKGERSAGVIAGGDRVAAPLVKIGLPESLAIRYAQSLGEQQAILVAVRVAHIDHARAAEAVLEQGGGKEIAVAGGALPKENQTTDMAAEQQLDAKLMGDLGQR